MSNKQRTDNLPASPVQQAPLATTYRADLNSPTISIPQPLLPVPKFGTPVSPDLLPETPATVAFDRAGNVPSSDKPSTGTIQGRQDLPSPLVTPTRFDPKLMRHVPVESAEVDKAQPVTAKPVHSVNLKLA